MSVPNICIIHVRSNDTSNDYICYRYPKNVTALSLPLLMKNYNVVTNSLLKKVTIMVTTLQVTALLPNPEHFA